MPLTWPIDKAANAISGHLATDSLERIRLLLEACMNEVRKHDNEMQQLRDSKTQEEAAAREEISRELLLEAARRAESTRAKERVKRIGLILANALVEPKSIDADEAEEMMRVASELSDRDIEYLRELIRIEGALLESADHIPRYDAYVKWEQGFWGDRINPEIDSLFSKLESYGLVARLAPPNNLNVLADFQNRYVLLKKGMRFASMISEAAYRS
jgi:chemotaxis protein histidine kinase CheA